jgi:hypothetical protein
VQKSIVLGGDDWWVRDTNACEGANEMMVKH